MFVCGGGVVCRTDRQAHVDAHVDPKKKNKEKIKQVVDKPVFVPSSVRYRSSKSELDRPPSDDHWRTSGVLRVRADASGATANATATKSRLQKSFLAIFPDGLQPS